MDDKTASLDDNTATMDNKTASMIYKKLNFRKAYVFGVNEVSEVIASLEVNDNTLEGRIHCLQNIRR